VLSIPVQTPTSGEKPLPDRHPAFTEKKICAGVQYAPRSRLSCSPIRVHHGDDCRPIMKIFGLLSSRLELEVVSGTLGNPNHID